MRDFRTILIDAAVGYLSSRFPQTHLNIVEVGCMFKEDEGLSTLEILRLLDAHPGGGRLISIEYDQTHVDAARKIIEKHNPALMGKVEFRCGHSLALLGAALDELGELHFVSLDGGAHPEVCLQEFEIASSKLVEDGLILVDDLHELAPSSAYSLPRPFGKGTLILPMLLLRNYISNREGFLHANAAPSGADAVPSAKSLEIMMGLEDVFPAMGDFALLGRGQKLLAYGSGDGLSVVKKAAKNHLARISLGGVIRCLRGRG